MDYGFILDLAVILFTAKIFSISARKLGLPEVVGALLAGLIVGPCILNIVKPTLFVSEIAEIGVIMLMFEAGLGTDLKKLRATGARATMVAAGGVIVPLVLGTLLYMLFYGFGAVGSDNFMCGLFIGTIMTATSVSITVAVLKEMGVLNSSVSTTITSAAIIDDVLGIIVLTMVIGMRSKDANTAVILLKAVGFFAVAAVSGVLVYNIFKYFDSKYQHTRRIAITGLAYCLFMAYIAQTCFGIADITGAYAAGVVLCNLSDSEYIERRVDISSYMIFAPVFFAGIGLKTSFESANTRLILFSTAFTLTAMLGKIVGCGGIARLSGLNAKKSLSIGYGMMARGEVALITAQKGLEAGLLKAEFFTPVIALILVSSFVTPVLLKRSFKN